MNIFFVDSDPKKAAQSLHDGHVVKMITESGQMLSAVTNVGYNASRWLPHPCTQWVAKSRQNAEWLLAHLEGLLSEYLHRYGDRTKFQRVREYLPLWRDAIKSLPDIGMTPPALVVYESAETATSDDPVEIYRHYYITRKLTDKNGKPFRWKNREKPEWLRQSETPKTTES